MSHTTSSTVGNETFVWRAETLWKAAAGLCPEAVPVGELTRIFDDINWAYSNPPPGVWADIHHAKRMFEADLAYPIILAADGSLMDGAHRLAKAWILGHETIQVIRFETDPEPDERRPCPEE